MNTKCRLKASAALCALVGSALAQGSEKSPVAAERDHLRNQRYCEILVVNRHGLSATAAVYNTVGLNDCPEEQWKALDPRTLKAESKAYDIVLNGPRFFTMDRNELKNPGAMHAFDGLEARLVAEVEISRADSDRKPYVERTVDRETRYVYEAGKDVYELVSPAGETYIMQSYSLEEDAHLNEGALAGLASRLILPSGWRYVVRHLSEDLTVRTNGSKAHILQDDLRNTYQRLD
jgi:hypothetical protein